MSFKNQEEKKILISVDERIEKELYEEYIEDHGMERKFIRWILFITFSLIASGFIENDIIRISLIWLLGVSFILTFGFVAIKLITSKNQVDLMIISKRITVMKEFNNRLRERDVKSTELSVTVLPKECSYESEEELDVEIPE